MTVNLLKHSKLFAGLTVLSMLTGFCAAPIAHAADPAPYQTCGTVIVPPGAGLGTPPAAITSLIPLLNISAYNIEASGNLFDGLLWITRAHKVDFSRSIASSIVASPDDTIFTIKLHPRHWSDGVPVTASDVKYTFDLIKRLGPIYQDYDTGGIPTLVKHFTVIDPETIQVTLIHPVNPDWFILNGLGQLYALPQHVWGKYSIDELWRHQTDPAFFKVVDGPFRLIDFAVGRHVIFGPNPTYELQKPMIHRFIMDFSGTSAGAELDGIKSGALDVANLPFSLWNAGMALPNIRKIRLMPNFGFDYMGMNFKNPNVAFFRDVRVRQAIADAINQKLADDLLLHGTTTPQYGPVPLQPPTFLSPNALAGKYPVGYDPARARALLDAAGWKVGPDGIRVKDDKRLSFTETLPSGGATSTLGAELMQQDLQKVGIEMKIKDVTFNQMLAIQNGPPSGWEAMGFGWSLSSYPSNGTMFGTGGGNNQDGYSDAKMDQLINDIRTKPGNAALFAYQDYAAEQQPVIFASTPGAVVLANPNLRGINKFLSPTGAWSPQYLHFTNPEMCDGSPDHHPS